MLCPVFLPTACPPQAGATSPLLFDSPHRNVSRDEFASRGGENRTPAARTRIVHTTIMLHPEPRSKMLRQRRMHFLRGEQVQVLLTPRASAGGRGSRPPG